MTKYVFDKLVAVLGQEAIRPLTRATATILGRGPFGSVIIGWW